MYVCMYVCMHACMCVDTIWGMMLILYILHMQNNAKSTHQVYKYRVLILKSQTHFLAWKKELDVILKQLGNAFFLKTFNAVAVDNFQLLILK